jgi:hypothetical protein
LNLKPPVFFPLCKKPIFPIVSKFNFWVDGRPSTTWAPPPLCIRPHFPSRSCSAISPHATTPSLGLPRPRPLPTQPPLRPPLPSAQLPSPPRAAPPPPFAHPSTSSSKTLRATPPPSPLLLPLPTRVIQHRLHAPSTSNSSPTHAPLSPHPTTTPPFTMHPVGSLGARPRSHGRPRANGRGACLKICLNLI